jgi:hypothetical protein
VRIGLPRTCSLWLSFGLAACGSDAANTGEPSFDRSELLDPASCQACHPGQYDEWSGSMHAYASQDPVFVAMNTRGQEETEGRLGTFCVNCHAPMAVRENLTEDGLNLAELPAEYRGVTCYFCHNADSVEGLHNNPIVLADDAAMRGPFDDAAANPAHSSAYSAYLDPERPEASELCGTCHDVTLTEELAGQEVALERTYAEWQDTLFAQAHDQGGVGCNRCHMPSSQRRDRSAEFDGAPERRSARHDFEGVDLALDPFPNRERQRLLVERSLASSLLAEICVAETGVFEVTLENAGSGHHWPSGASHDREAWLEVQAFVEGEAEPVFRTVAPEAEDEALQRVVLKDHVVNEEGEPAHMFWDVADVASSTTLPGVATRDPLDPEFHRERRIWTFNTNQAGAAQLDRVTLTVRIRPIGLAILDDLVESGHLDVELARAMTVIDVLPDRCYDRETVERHPDVLAAVRAECEDPSTGEFTLVWLASEANQENRTFRASRVDGAPARCLSHPTYVSVPQVP